MLTAMYTRIKPSKQNQYLMLVGFVTKEEDWKYHDGTNVLEC
jgi:hypothetical protein